MLSLNDITNLISSQVKKIWPTLSLNRKRLTIVVVGIVAIFLALVCVSCGVTRTTVRTNGKGTTNAQISITTNNPTSVSVETRIDSTKVSVNKSSK